MKIFTPIEAVTEMGLLCTKQTSRIYLRNMFEAGLLKSSKVLNGRWHVTKEDIDFVRTEINEGRYKPSAKHFKKAA